jgi:formylglycine-generating enzyme required for sulfatase activity
VELLVAGVRPCVPQETLTLPGGVPMTFSFIPPGAFLMGSDKGEEDERPVHRVEVSRGFFMGVYPVTQAQWHAVVGDNPRYGRGPQRPVENVSWEECWEFCANLSEITRRGVELPAEAEWEYACRAGTTTEYHFGDALSTDLASYNRRDEGNEDCVQTTDVGSFPANPWGLHDMHGNVWEWCANEYGPYAAREQDDNAEHAHDTFLVLRGGCWGGGSDLCRSAFRNGQPLSYRSDAYGFRVCLRLA